MSKNISNVFNARMGGIFKCQVCGARHKETEYGREWCKCLVTVLKRLYWIKQHNDKNLNFTAPWISFKKDYYTRRSLYSISQIIRTPMGTGYKIEYSPIKSGYIKLEKFKQLLAFNGLKNIINEYNRICDKELSD